jgi:hypothetical protein
MSIRELCSLQVGDRVMMKPYLNMAEHGTVVSIPDCGLGAGVEIKWDGGTFSVIDDDLHAVPMMNVSNLWRENSEPNE